MQKRSVPYRTLFQANLHAWTQKSSVLPVRQARLLVHTLLLSSISAQSELLSLHEVSVYFTNKVYDGHPLTSCFTAFGSIKGRRLVTTHQWLC
jgi:hypothetical protein